MNVRQRLQKRKLFLRRLGVDSTWCQMTDKEKRKIARLHAFYVLKDVDKAMKVRALKNKESK